MVLPHVSSDVDTPSPYTSPQSLKGYAFSFPCLLRRFAAQRDRVKWDLRVIQIWFAEIRATNRMHCAEAAERHNHANLRLRNARTAPNLARLPGKNAKRKRNAVLRATAATKVKILRAQPLGEKRAQVYGLPALYCHE